MSFCLLFVGLVLLPSGRVEEARQAAERGLRLVDRHDCRHIAGAQEIVLSTACHILGDDRGARDAADRALALGSWWGAWEHLLRALFDAVDGSYAAAWAEVRRVYDEWSEVVPNTRPDAIVCLGVFACLAGDFERASRLFGAALSRGGLGSSLAAALWLHYVNILRSKLDHDTRERLRAEGAQMSFDEAVAYGTEGEEVARTTR